MKVNISQKEVKKLSGLYYGEVFNFDGVKLLFMKVNSNYPSTEGFTYAVELTTGNVRCFSYEEPVQVKRSGWFLSRQKLLERTHPLLYCLCNSHSVCSHLSTGLIVNNHRLCYPFHSIEYLTVLSR